MTLGAWNLCSFCFFLDAKIDGCIMARKPKQNYENFKEENKNG